MNISQSFIRITLENKNHFILITSLGQPTGIWIIETKGRIYKTGDSEDIDKYTAKKFGVLKAYVDKYKLLGGIVRQDKQKW